MKAKVKPINPVCRIVEYGLRIIGVWPNAPYAILCRILSISIMIVFQIFQYQHVIMHLAGDLSVLMDILSLTLAYSLLLFKMIIFAFKIRLLDNMIVCMTEDWKECDISNKHIMTKMAYMSRRFSNLIIIANASAVTLYGIGSLLQSNSDDQTITKNLIVKMELPFEIESTSIYVATLFIQFVHVMSVACLVAVIDSLLITLVLHISGQIDIIRQKLGEITQKDIEHGTTESVVKTLVVRHQKIISFSNNIDTLFSNIVLIQFVLFTMLICSLGFVIVMSIGVPNGSKMLIKSVFFFININVEAFIFCFFGEYLIAKSRKVGDAVYESIWYDLTPMQNRNLLLIIVRSQKHLAITVGKIVDLSLMQFASIMKASASYVSVLHAMT